MSIEDCKNPSKPCNVHDPSNEWRIEFGPTTIHSGWFVAAAVILFIASTGFN